MIVVRVNLYRGQAEHRQRKRPKVLVACLAAVLLGAWGVSDISESRGLAALREQVEGAQRHVAGLAKELAAAQAADLELHSAIARREPILSYASQRRNWAPVLAKVLAAIPSSAELSGLEIDAQTLGRPMLRVRGRCESTQPRLEADKCLLQITHALATAGMPMQGKFAALEDIEPALIGAADSRAVAEFVLEFTTPGESDAN